MTDRIEIGTTVGGEDVIASGRYVPEYPAHYGRYEFGGYGWREAEPEQIDDLTIVTADTGRDLDELEDEDYDRIESELLAAFNERAEDDYYEAGEARADRMREEGL